MQKKKQVINLEFTNFHKNLKATSKFWASEGDTKQVSHRWPTNAWRHPTKLTGPGYQAPAICAFPAANVCVFLPSSQPSTMIRCECFSKHTQAVRANLLPSTVQSVKMNLAEFFEMLLRIYQTGRNHITEWACLVGIHPADSARWRLKQCNISLAAARR